MLACRQTTENSLRCWSFGLFSVLKLKLTTTQLVTIYSRRPKWQQLRVIQIITISCLSWWGFFILSTREVENGLSLYKISLLSIFLNWRTLYLNKIIVLKPKKARIEFKLARANPSAGFFRLQNKVIPILEEKQLKMYIFQFHSNYLSWDVFKFSIPSLTPCIPVSPTAHPTFSPLITPSTPVFMSNSVFELPDWESQACPSS